MPGPFDDIPDGSTGPTAPRRSSDPFGDIPESASDLAPEGPGLPTRIWHGVESVLSAPSRAVMAGARAVGRLEGLDIPEELTPGATIREAAGLSPDLKASGQEGNDTIPRRVLGAATEFAGGVAADPTTYLLGGASKLAGAGAEAAGFIGPRAIDAAAEAAKAIKAGEAASTVGRAAAAAFVPGMASSAVQGAKETYRRLRTEGLSPAAAEAAANTVLSGAFALGAGRHAAMGETAPTLAPERAFADIPDGQPAPPPIATEPGFEAPETAFQPAEEPFHVKPPTMETPQGTVFAGEPPVEPTYQPEPPPVDILAEREFLRGNPEAAVNAQQARMAREYLAGRRVPTAAAIEGAITTPEAPRLVPTDLQRRDAAELARVTPALSGMPDAELQKREMFYRRSGYQDTGDAVREEMARRTAPPEASAPEPVPVAPTALAPNADLEAAVREAEAAVPEQPEAPAEMPPPAPSLRAEEPIPWAISDHSLRHDAASGIATVQVPVADVLDLAREDINRPGRAGQIVGQTDKLTRARHFLADAELSRTPVQLPEISVQNGKLVIDDGYHRTQAAADSGVGEIPVRVAREDLAKLRELGLPYTDLLTGARHEPGETTGGTGRAVSGPEARPTEAGVQGVPGVPPESVGPGARPVPHGAPEGVQLAPPFRTWAESHGYAFTGDRNMALAAQHAYLEAFPDADRDQFRPGAAGGRVSPTFVEPPRVENPDYERFQAAIDAGRRQAVEVPRHEAEQALRESADVLEKANLRKHPELIEDMGLEGIADKPKLIRAIREDGDNPIYQQALTQITDRMAEARQPKFQARALPGQRGLPGVAEDVAQPRERQAKPEQRSLFGGEMLQPTEANVTEGRESAGPLFTQEQEAAARRERAGQGTLPLDSTVQQRARISRLRGMVEQAGVMTEAARQRMGMPDKIAGLRREIEDAWPDVPQADRDRLAGLMPSRATLDREAPKFATAPTFYSQLERAAEKIPQAMSGKDMLRYLQDPKRGVKADELKWTGLDDFLKGKYESKVTPEDVREFVRQNNVQVKEVTLGERQGPEIQAVQDQMDALQAEADALRQQNNDFQGDAPTGEYRKWQDMNRRWSELRAQKFQLTSTGPQPKFSQYTLPGGENYRELLLTLPSKAPDTSGWRAEEVLKKNPINGNPDFKVVKPDGTWTIQHSATTPEEAIAIASRFEQGNKGTFRSSHFDEPNVLAHVRFNDRTDAQGKKTLFIEEVQSDFGQQHRRMANDVKTMVSDDWTGFVKRLKDNGALRVECD